MSILHALTRAWLRQSGPQTPRNERLPPFGYSFEKVGALISLGKDGRPVGLPMLYDRQVIAVPQPPPKRTSGILSAFLSDKTSYSLGVTTKETKTVEKHKAFVELHRQSLADCDDEGIQAFLSFLDWWTPEKFAELAWPEEMKDRIVIFALEDERLEGLFLHDRPAAKDAWAARLAQVQGQTRRCLVTGELAPVARLHPSIKGVGGAHPSGPALVSFEQEAFKSWGFEQGDNAQISEKAAFAYSSVLNSFLTTDSGHRMQLADTTMVFWAEAQTPEQMVLAEKLFRQMFESPSEKKDGGGEGKAARTRTKKPSVAPIDCDAEAQKVGGLLQNLREGKSLASFEPSLSQGVRFYLLGLAPNNGRLSVRLWLDNDFADLAKNYQKFWQEITVLPEDRSRGMPPLWVYASEIALLKDRKNLPPNLIGQWMLSILSGRRYPETLLSLTLLRIRADREINGLRAGILRALLCRNYSTVEAPERLAEDCSEKGYVLGRLFAILERAQEAALGRKVNSTIRDKFYVAASTRPGTVFPQLLRNAQNHVGKMRRNDMLGFAIFFDKAIGKVLEKLSPRAAPFPTKLSPAQQASFALGCYHQWYSEKEEEKEPVAVVETPGALEKDCSGQGYVLGRLFVLLERVQEEALGKATIRESFYAAASIRSGAVFPQLRRRAEYHMKKNRRDKYGIAEELDKELGEVLDKLSASGTPIPTVLPSAQQAEFVLGYYHQRQDYFKKTTGGTVSAEAVAAAKTPSAS